MIKEWWKTIPTCICGGPYGKKGKLNVLKGSAP